jgi:hypothetical protein
VDAKDDLPEAVKIINAVSITIKAMRGDGKKSPLTDKYVVDIIKVLKTTSVDGFNLKSHLPGNNNNNTMTSNESSSHPSTSTTQESSSSPLISRRIFTPSSPPALPDNIPSTKEPELRCSTRSNLGSAPDHLNPSTHTLKFHHQATNNNGSNVTSIEHYCNVLGIKLPSATRAQEPQSRRLFKNFLHK